MIRAQVMMGLGKGLLQRVLVGSWDHPVNKKNLVDAKRLTALQEGITCCTPKETQIYVDTFSH